MEVVEGLVLYHLLMQHTLNINSSPKKIQSEIFELDISHILNHEEILIPAIDQSAVWFSNPPCYLTCLVEKT